MDGKRGNRHRARILGSGLAALPFVGIMLTGITVNLLLTSPISADTVTSKTPVDNPKSADTVPPAAPAGFQAEAVTQANLITLSWNQSANAAGYTLFRDGKWLADIPGTASSYSDLTVEPNLAYTYQLQAYDAAGTKSVAVSLSVLSLDTLPPTTPAIFKGKAVAGNQIQLIWSPSTDNREVAYYRIYCSKNGAGMEAIAGSKQTYFIDEGLGPGYHYEYKITAVDAAGNESQFSRPVSITTPGNFFNVVEKKLPLSVNLQD